MSNPTSNFGWQMPTSTDLVTDLPADFEVFGQAVDTSLADLKGGTTGQVLKKNSNTDMDFVWSADSAGMTNPMTTTGDTIYSSSGSTPARLGIGSTGQVLAVSGGLPTWTTLSAADSTWTLLNAGGTALTGAATITVSGISTNNIWIWISKGSSANASSKITLRLNGDTGANYNYQLLKWNTTSAGNEWGDLDTSINLGQTGNSAASSLSSTIQIAGTKSTTLIPITLASAPSGDQYIAMAGSANYSASAAITSISVISNSGNFDAGTIFVYGRN